MQKQQGTCVKNSSSRLTGKWHRWRDGRFALTQPATHYFVAQRFNLVGAFLFMTRR